VFRPRRIRTRIALFCSLVVTLALVIFGVLLYLLAALGGQDDRDKALTDRAEATLATIETATDADLAPGRAPAPIEIEESLELFVVILDQTGAVIVSTGEVDGAPPVIPAGFLAAAADGHARGTFALTPDLDARLYAVPWSRPDLGLGGFVVVGQSTQKLREDLRAVVAFIVIAAAISLIAAFAATWRVAGRAVRPLQAMAATADEIGGAADLSRRLPEVARRDEIARLTASFNGMLGRLEEAHRQLTETLAREQRFVADASHELRTPLTSIRTNADFLLGHPDAAPDDRQAAVADIAAESERMSRMVQDLLTLARADAGQRLEREPVDLAPLLEDLRRQAQRLHPAREVVLIRGGPDQTAEAIVYGDPVALRQLVWVMVDNALKHGGPTARVWLCLVTEGDRALIRVADDGPGIPDGAEECVFERFYQADAARSGDGAGLGLAIARWIAEEHGGRTWARNNDGPGASFFAELPRCPALPVQAD
jgi:two-component system, OmpR family, sensor kinase